MDKASGGGGSPNTARDIELDEKEREYNNSTANTNSNTNRSGGGGGGRTTAAAGANEEPYNEDEAEIVVDEELEQLSKFTKLVAPAFGLFALYSIAAIVVSFFPNPYSWIMVVALLAGNVVFSAAGAIGIYRWGTVAEQIDGFKEENNRYKLQLSELSGTRLRLHDRVNKLQETTGGLKRNVKELNSNLAQFDELKESLKEICEDSSEIAALMDNINGMYDDMRTTVLENERAQILCTYYDCSLNDGQDGLSKTEYKLFLALLDSNTRAKFESYGSFEYIAGKDNVIDLEEFSRLVDTLLQDCEQELLNQGLK